MKHLKLFEGFYSDKIKELKDNIKEDLTDWLNVITDEIEYPVEIAEPYLSGCAGCDEGDDVDSWFPQTEGFSSSLLIDFSKKPPSDEVLDFICKTYCLMIQSLKDDYWVSGVWTTVSGSKFELIDWGDYGYNELHLIRGTIDTNKIDEPSEHIKDMRSSLKAREVKLIEIFFKTKY